MKKKFDHDEYNRQYQRRLRAEDAQNDTGHCWDSESRRAEIEWSKKFMARLESDWNRAL